MAIKNISIRMKICGRGAMCSGGHSAVEQSGYICREKMYSEYDGQTYSAGGSFETTIGKTKYEVVMNFKDEGMSMQEKALRVVKEGAGKDEKSA